MDLIVSETWGTVGVATATANTVLMIEPHSLDELTAIPHALPSAESELEVNRVRLAADEQLAPLTYPGKQILLCVRSGRVQIRLDTEIFSFESGDVISFNGEYEVAPRAVEPSEALVVLADPTDWGDGVHLL